MKINGSYSFDASRDIVWESLQDPVVLASVLPGCEKLDLVGENAYEGALKIKVGPVQGKFNGKVQLEDIVEPESYTMKVDGRGAPGFVKATAQVQLEEQGDTTEMTYDADAQVGGRIASVGQRLLDSSAKAIIKQSLEGLNFTVKARMAAANGDGDDAGDEASAAEQTAQEGDADTPEAAAEKPSVPVYQKPSQAEFAATIAKEVAKDIVPKPVLVGGIVAIILGALWFLLG